MRGTKMKRYFDFADGPTGADGPTADGAIATTAPKPQLFHPKAVKKGLP